MTLSTILLHVFRNASIRAGYARLKVGRSQDTFGCTPVCSRREHLFFRTGSDCVVMARTSAGTGYFPVFARAESRFESHLGHICSKNDLLGTGGHFSYPAPVGRACRDRAMRPAGFPSADLAVFQWLPFSWSRVSLTPVHGPRSLFDVTTSTRAFGSMPIG